MPGITETRCVVCSLEGSQLRFAGYGQAPSAGWSKGRLADSSALSSQFAKRSSGPKAAPIP